MFYPKAQCKAIIIAKKRRCLKSEIGCSEYCEFHGPLCQALTNVGMPCNSMVLNFRKGYIYCENHANINIERHIGMHEACCNINLSDQRKRSTENKDVYPGNTIIEQTTTTITTSNTDHLCKIFDLLELSKKH